MIDASPRAAWLVSGVTALLAAAALVVGFGLAAPAAAHVSIQPPCHYGPYQSALLIWIRPAIAARG
jgi:hypothetical protein